MDVRTLSLGVLTHRPMTGYEIKKCLEADFRHVVSAGYGSIYPALAELAAEGSVTVEAVEQDKRPDKKVYAITAQGRTRLVEELVATEPRHRVRSEFLVLMYFAHLLPEAKVRAVLDSMVQNFEHWLHEGIEACERSHQGPSGQPLSPGMRFALGYGRTVIAAALEYMKQERPAFLRELTGEQREPPVGASRADAAAVAPRAAE
jgi:PadR family transcriptional regulator, regulatory protein AphA